MLSKGITKILAKLLMHKLRRQTKYMSKTMSNKRDCKKSKKLRFSNKRIKRFVKNRKKQLKHKDNNKGLQSKCKKERLNSSRKK